MTEVKKKVGRPRLNPFAVKREPLNMRTTPDLRAKIEAACLQSGRSMSAEVEYRIRRSFDMDEYAAALRGAAQT